MNDFLLHQLNKLNAEQRIALRKHFVRLHSHTPEVLNWLSNWDLLIRLALNPKPIGKTKYGKRNRKPFTLVERSIPISIGDSVWFLRIIYNRIEKQFLLDIREFELEQTRREDKFKPTVNGISLPIPHWYTLLNVAFKLMQRWKNK